MVAIVRAKIFTISIPAETPDDMLTGIWVGRKERKKDNTGGWEIGKGVGNKDYVSSKFALTKCRDGR